VIELAGPAANGARGHVGLTIDAPVAAVTAFKEKFNKRFNYLPDHNGIKGYTGMYLVKYVTEKNKKFDSKAFADAAHGLTVDPKDEPGILMTRPGTRTAISTAKVSSRKSSMANRRS